MLMVGSFSGGVELWDIESGEEAFTLQPEQPPDDRAAAYRKVIPPAIILPGTR